MWRSKKPDTSQAADAEAKNSQTNQSLKHASTVWERTTQVIKDASRPTEETADHVKSRLGSSLHVKGDISGNEGLYIDGTAEGLVLLDE